MLYLVLILYIICGATFVTSKWALSYAPPFFYLAIRMGLSGFLLLFYYLIKSGNFEFKKSFASLIKDWNIFLQIILFHIYLTYTFDLIGLKELTSIESSFIYNLSPFVAAFFSYIWFSEKMTFKKWIGLSLGFIGLILQFSPNIFSFNLLKNLWPKLITFGAVISSAYGWIIFRELIKDDKYSAIFINGISMFVGGILALITSFFVESWDPFPVQHWGTFFQSIILIIFIANILFYNLYGFLLKFYTVTFLSFAGFLCPFFTSILANIFLGEQIGIELILSGIVVAFGLSIFYYEELRQGYIKES